MKRSDMSPGATLKWASLLTLFFCNFSYAQDAEPPDGSFVIEAEDWNFDGGEFIDDPSIGFGADSYFGQGIDLGEPNVDLRRIRQRFASRMRQLNCQKATARLRSLTRWGCRSRRQARMR